MWGAMWGAMWGLMWGKWVEIVFSFFHFLFSGGEKNHPTFFAPHCFTYYYNQYYNISLSPL